jgi:hypothetical protein
LSVRTEEIQIEEEAKVKVKEVPKAVVVDDEALAEVISPIKLQELGINFRG